MMQQGKSRIEHTEGSVHDWNFSTAETNGVYILSGSSMKYGRPEPHASLSKLGSCGKNVVIYYFRERHDVLFFLTKEDQKNFMMLN